MIFSSQGRRIGPIGTVIRVLAGLALLTLAYLNKPAGLVGGLQLHDLLLGLVALPAASIAVGLLARRFLDGQLRFSGRAAQGDRRCLQRSAHPRRGTAPGPAHRRRSRVPHADQAHHRAQSRTTMTIPGGRHMIPSPGRFAWCRSAACRPVRAAVGRHAAQAHLPRRRLILHA